MFQLSRRRLSRGGNKVPVTSCAAGEITERGKALPTKLVAAAKYIKLDKPPRISNSNHQFVKV